MTVSLAVEGQKPPEITLCQGSWSNNSVLQTQAEGTLIKQTLKQDEKAQKEKK